MEDINETSTVDNFIISERNCYAFLCHYAETLIIFYEQATEAGHFTQAHQTQHTISLSLIENIQLHLLTRATLLQKQTIHIDTSSPFKNRLTYLVEHLKQFTKHSNSKNDTYTNNSHSHFPDYNYRHSIKGMYDKTFITQNPWRETT